MLLTVVWFFTLPQGILMGDDLALVYGVQHGVLTPLSSLTTTPFDKYRPIPTLMFWLLISLFGNHFTAYELVNVGVESVCALLVFAIALRVSRGNVWVATCAGALFITSRFAYYQVVQVMGLFEGLALAFALAAIREVAIAYQSGTLARLWRTPVWFALVIFTDERYVVLAPFLVLAALLHPAARARGRETIALAAAPLLLVAANVLLKERVFHARFLTGTGTKPISHDPWQVASFFWTGLLSVAGFNTGPDYLSARDVSELGAAGYMLGSLCALGALGAFGVYLFARARESAAAVTRDVVLGLALFVPLLLSAAVTFRQEYRWLYAADAALIVGLAAAAAPWRAHPAAVRSAAGALAAACILTSLAYRSYLGNVYFMYSMGDAKTVRAAVTAHRHAPAVIISHNDRSIARWVFQRHEFFDEYGLGDVPVTFIAAGPGPPAAIDPKADTFDIRGGQVVEYPPVTVQRP